MKNLTEILNIQQISGAVPLTVSAVEFDSRRVTSGALFVAVRGTLTDGHNYIERAVELGAVCVVCQVMPDTMRDEVCYIQVEDTSVALAHIAAAFYDYPSAKLSLVGVTGTNGKTTTVTLLHTLMTRLGYTCGLLSTVVNKIGESLIPATHTTPDPVTLNRLMAQMVERGCEYCFMEVSSHSVVQNRVLGLTFAGGVFTNLTHDHLDYHGTFAEYLRAKKGFFDALTGKAFALTNADDRNGEVMLQNCKARRRVSYSLRTLATYHCRVLESHLDGMLLEMCSTELWVQFLGRFNAYNLTAIYGVAMELGMDRAEVLRILSTLLPVDGRFECIRSGDGKLAVVDYAHTPDALQNVLSTIDELRGAGRIITVVGCGGDRDAAKRPVMARIAAQMSSQVVLTSDNPRSECPDEILRQMQQGLDPVERRRCLMIEQRGEAIRTAVALAGSGDVILIAGKGHETYQEIQGVRYHFDDREVVREAFEK